MCPDTTIYVSAYYYICVLILLYMCSHTTIYVSLLLCMCPHYMCPHATIHVSAYYYTCVRILLCMCPHLAIHAADDGPGAAGERAARELDFHPLLLLQRCPAILTYAMLTYADVCRRMLTRANSTSTPSSSAKGAERPRLMQEDEVPEHLLGERIAAGHIHRLGVCWRVA
jgi:hypothetical protein